MRIYFAFDAQPVQLKLVNWILDRTDIDRTVLMDEMKKEMDAKRADSTAKTPIVDANKVFIGFQSEVKKWALKLGNMGNQFQDCIYTRCGKEDEDFKYVFGESNKPEDITSSYQHKVNDVYDAMSTAISFKDGKYREQAEKILEGFKKKNESLEKLVADANQILVENNKNNEDDDDRTFGEQEDDSWKTLEQNEVYSSGQWHVYKVEVYEDLRNVAADYTSWCVARRDSGRDYFYRHYGPPYYLFCKGRRRPTILMHIKSQQFKGVDDSKYKPDRPTSMDAIEIGRELLRKLGEFKKSNLLDDFSIFKDDTEIYTPEITSSINEIPSMSDDELLNLIDTVDDDGTLEKIADNSKDYNVLSRAYQKSRNKNTKLKIAHTLLWEKSSNYLKNMDINGVKKLCATFVGECEERYRLQMMTHIMQAFRNEAEMVIEIADRFFEPDDIVKCVNDLPRHCNNMNAFIKYFASKGMDSTVYETIWKIDERSLSPVIDTYHDDDGMMGKIIKVVSDWSVIYEIAKTTNSQSVLGLVVDDICKFRQTDNQSVIDTYRLLWKKVTDNGMLQKLFAPNFKFDDGEVFRIMMGNARTVEQKCKALNAGCSQDELDRCFEKVIDGIEMNEENRSLLLEAFFGRLSKSKLPKLCDKIGYSFEMLRMRSDITPDIIYGIAKSMEYMREFEASSLLDRVEQLGETEHGDGILIEILNKCNSFNVTYRIIKLTKSEHVKQHIIDSRNSISAAYKLTIIEETPSLATEKNIRKIAEEIPEHQELVGVKLSRMKNCPADVVRKLSNEIGSLSKNLRDDFMLSEFGKGLVDDEKGFIIDRCRKVCGNETDKSLNTIVGMLKDDVERLSRIVGYVFESTDFGKQDLDILAYEFVSAENKNGVRPGAMSKCIEWCIRNKRSGDVVMRSPSSTEEQIRDACEWMTRKELEDVLYKASPLAKKVIGELGDDGEISIDWKGVVYSPNATEDELARTVDSLASTTDYEKILNHPNCTQKVADLVLDRKSTPFESLLVQGALKKWIDAGEVLSWKYKVNGADRYCIRKWKELEKVAEAARSVDGLRKVVGFMDKVEEDETNSYASGSSSIVLCAVVGNGNCTSDYFDEIYTMRDDKSYRRALVEKYINGHLDMPAADIEKFADRYFGELGNDKNPIRNIFICVNMTEEVAVRFMRKYNYVNLFCLSKNKNLTERMILEAMDLTYNDESIRNLISLPQAGEAAYEKALEMFAGWSSVEYALDHVQNMEMKEKYTKRKESAGSHHEFYPIADAINRETDDARLKRLVAILFDTMEKNKDDSIKYSICHIDNRKAIEMLVKSRNEDIWELLMCNKNVPSSIVLSHIKRSQSSRLFSNACHHSSNKDILMLVCCRTKNERDIKAALERSYNIRNFNSDDIMTMIKLNPNLKFEILRSAYFKLSDDQLRYLRERLRDMDIEWLVDKIMQHRHPEGREAKAERIVRRMLRASIIVDRIVSDYKE